MGAMSFRWTAVFALIMFFFLRYATPKLSRAQPRMEVRGLDYQFKDGPGCVLAGWTLLNGARETLINLG